jgi:hypothetical protein
VTCPNPFITGGLATPERQKDSSRNLVSHCEDMRGCLPTLAKKAIQLLSLVQSECGCSHPNRASKVTLLAKTLAQAQAKMLESVMNQDGWVLPLPSSLFPLPLTATELTAWLSSMRYVPPDHPLDMRPTNAQPALHDLRC